MRTSARAAVVLVVSATFIAVMGCRDDKARTRDATPETVLVVAPPPAPAAPDRFDAGPDRFDAAPDAAVVAAPPTAKRTKSAPPQPARGKGGIGALQTTGNQPKAVAEAYLRGKVASLLSCYAGGRERHPGQHGRLYLKLSMNERGAVELAEVLKSTVSDDDGQMCLVQAIRRLKFPPPPGGGESTVTFQLGL
jgi:hypothetical protein